MFSSVLFVLGFAVCFIIAGFGCLRLLWVLVTLL